MAKRYYTLAVRDDGRWGPQFGDYDRTVVVDEWQEYVDNGEHRLRELKIVESGDTQEAITAAIARLNASK